jgi:intein-encoded DNA endonuclease-like protein
MKRKVPTSEYQNMIQKYNDGMSQRDIAKEYGVVPSTVLLIFNKLNVSRHNPYHLWRKYNFNMRFFQQINSEEKAYWLGFIVADGNVHNQCLSINLSARDEKHLEKFASAIDYDYWKDYRSVKNSCRIRLHSKDMVADLQQFGIVPKKSSKIVVPKIDDGLYRHFFRGYIDGDGSLCITGKRKVVNASSTCFNFLFGLKGWIDNELRDDVGNIYKASKNKHSTTFLYIVQNKKHVLPFLRRLYDDCTVALDRKLKTYHEWACA